MISVIACQICGVLDRCMNDDPEPVLLKLMKIYMACGYPMKLCKLAAEKVVRKHVYVKTLLEVVLKKL